MPGASIFLVEDEALIRMMLAEMVEELGHRVVAEAGNIKEGQALARRDRRKARTAVYLCEWLRARGPTGSIH
jgi:CheY-like chemotaxis protein